MQPTSQAEMTRVLSFRLLGTKASSRPAATPTAIAPTSRGREANGPMGSLEISPGLDGMAARVPSRPRRSIGASNGV